MNTSGGGGYCDCGDVEAWTSDPSCEIHGITSEQDQVSSQSSKLVLPKSVYDVGSLCVSYEHS